jgi:hypothetical protein
MATRPTTTLLLLTRQVIVRADFSSTNQPLDVWSQPRPDVHEWPILAEIALALGPKPVRNVYVLSSDLWTQTLGLTNISTVSLSAEDLASALNFEAEQMSGQSALEAVVAVQPLSGGQGYWIVQARSADFEQVDKIVAEAGGRLRGLLHPGGLPRALRTMEESTGSWVRAEFWPDTVLFLRGDAQGSPLVQVHNADGQMGQWKPAWSAWRQDAGDKAAHEDLTGPGVLRPPLPDSHSIPLENGAKLSAWLTAWAKQLTGKTPTVPLLQPARKPMSTLARQLIAFGMAALALAICWASHTSLDGALQRLNAETKAAQQPAKKLAEVQKQVQELQVKHKEMEAQAANLGKATAALKTQRQRLARLLTCLSEQQMEHLQINKIDAEAGEPRLFGVCLQPEMADQFANRLAQPLAEQGWEVLTPKKQAMKLLVSGGPWSFEIQLHSISSFTVDLPMAKKDQKK